MKKNWKTKYKTQKTMQNEEKMFFFFFGWIEKSVWKSFVQIISQSVKHQIVKMIESEC